VVRLEAMVLVRLGKKPSLIQERVLYPAHSPPFTGRVSRAFHPALRFAPLSVALERLW